MSAYLQCMDEHLLGPSVNRLFMIESSDGCVLCTIDIWGLWHKMQVSRAWMWDVNTYPVPLWCLWCQSLHFTIKRTTNTISQHSVSVWDMTYHTWLKGHIIFISHRIIHTHWNRLGGCDISLISVNWIIFVFFSDMRIDIRVCIPNFTWFKKLEIGCISNGPSYVDKCRSICCDWLFVTYPLLNMWLFIPWLGCYSPRYHQTACPIYFHYPGLATTEPHNRMEVSTQSIWGIDVRTDVVYHFYDVIMVCSRDVTLFKALSGSKRRKIIVQIWFIDITKCLTFSKPNLSICNHDLYWDNFYSDLFKVYDLSNWSE